MSERSSSSPLRQADRAVTVADVAERARVSTAAVSFYFSDRAEHLKRVGSEARERIRAAVEELGYVPNKTARHLRRQRSERLCIILPKLGIPYGDKIVQDLGRVAVEGGLLPIVSTASTRLELEKVLAEVEAGLADGVVADVEYLTVDEVNDVFLNVTRDCLIIHATARSEQFSVLNNGLTAALEVAFDDLVAKGHRNFAYIENSWSGENPRLATLMDRVRRADGAIRMMTMVGASERSSAAVCARAIASLDDRPTAVLVDSDYTAVTVIAEFARMEIRVPQDIAVLGCGNAEEGEFSNPSLSTIGPEWLSLDDAGRYLVESLVRNEKRPSRQFHTSWRYLPRESA